MKLAFSTVATPNSDWNDICSMARDLGYDGVEVRDQGGDLIAMRSHPFTRREIPNTIKKLKQMHLSIPCFSTSCCLKHGEQQEENRQEIINYIRLASTMGSPYVRVLADQGPRPGGEVDDELILSQLLDLAPIAEEYEVTLLVETAGVYGDSARLGQLLNRINYDSVGALWDLHHPYRFFDEDPETTVQNLGAYIKHVHVKDSVIENGEVAYKMMGEGDLPIEKMMQALKSIDYNGYFALEWAKRWSLDLEDAGVVIPHYAFFMNSYKEGRNGHQEQLYTNKRGDGHYIWEKESLIELTFPQLLERVVEAFPDQPAFRYTTQDYSRSYSEFREDVDTFARALIARGVKRGDKVAIWATNIPQWFITFWAATKIGAVLVTVNTAYKIHEAEYLLRQSDTHTLVMIEEHKDSPYGEIIQAICPELAEHDPAEPLYSRRLPFLRNVITVDFHMPGCLTWEQTLAYAEETPVELVYQRMAMINRHDVCNMQYTSGTTGFPKGVMLTHYNVVNNGKNIGDRMDLSTADRFLIHVPMFHCFGMVLSMAAAVTHGSAMVPLPAYSPKLALDAVEQEKITAMNGVPTMFIAMLEHPDFASTDFSSLRTGIMAGSPCPIKVMQDVVDKMHMPEITIVFGQTESSPGCTMSSADDPIALRVQTVGRPLPGIECKIVDPATGEDLPDNIDGEFVARGYNIMKGYYKMPAATAAAIDGEGWLHTGDIARRLPDGNFRITGRLRDMIIRGGENIYPKEIEDFIYTHPKVRDVQVIGVPDEQYGEDIMAWVVLKEGEHSDEKEIKTFVRDHMAKHKTPRYVHFVDSFPMNAAGKILKYKMVEESTEMLGLTGPGETA